MSMVLAATLAVSLVCHFAYERPLRTGCGGVCS